MMTREEFLKRISSGSLLDSFQAVNRALMVQITNNLTREETPEDWEQRDPKRYDTFLLNNVGPARAAASIERALRVCKNSDVEFRGAEFTGDMVQNLRVVQNFEQGGYNNFSNTLRQFLLPRYAYFDFDAAVDPRHRIDFECGYPRFIFPFMYRYMFERDETANRVVSIYPDETWADDPEVYDEEDESKETKFEGAWKELCEDYQLLQYLYRMDKLCGVGHYGVLLMGLDDGKELDQPVGEPELLKGKRKTVSTKERKLLYLRPFDEYLSFIQEFDTDLNSPRYGMPIYYTLVFVDMTIDAAGAAIGTRVNRRVHWTRVIHVADNLESSLVFGIPRQQRPFNRLLDLRKVTGSSGEMYYKGAFPGLSIELNPDLAGDDPDIDVPKLREEMDQYFSGIRRYIAMIGMSAKTLAPNVSDPKPFVTIYREAISSHMNVPFRIFQGSEEARLASSEDKLTWNRRLGRRRKTFVDPGLIRATADRFIAVGVLPAPQGGKYVVGWPSLNVATDEDKANLALKWTQAISQYVASGMIHLIPPLDYFTLIVGLSPSDSVRLVDQVEKEGGFEKLKKVDPSQGSGVNGVRTNDVTPGQATGSSSRARDTERQTADKKTEGAAS